MKIDGTLIAQTLLSHVEPTVASLKKRGVVPTLAVVQIGDDAGSSSYIRQKQLAAQKTGISLVLYNKKLQTAQSELMRLISTLNNTSSIHGIIIQRPVPKHIEESGVLSRVLPMKDVDGFVPNSPFDVPVAKAVGTILETVHNLEAPGTMISDWLSNVSVGIIGRGQTAGRPIQAYLIKTYGITPYVIHSQTIHPEEYMRNADIIISCVGKQNVVRRHLLKQGVVLIGVGIRRDSSGLQGDYDEQEIASVASYWTPTPKGVGPVNVAHLMVNVCQAASMST